LAIGVILGGHWKALPTEEFLEAFRTSLPFIGRLVPAVLMPTVAGLAGSLWFAWDEKESRVLWLMALASTAALLMLTAAWFGPLRKRRDDIPLLFEYFVQRFSDKMGKHIRTIEKDTLARCRAYDWPGNIRELQNIVERSVILCTGSTFRVERAWLSAREPSTSPAPPLTERSNTGKNRSSKRRLPPLTGKWPDHEAPRSGSASRRRRLNGDCRTDKFHEVTCRVYDRIPA
jgi:hypothetical protein